MGDEAIDSEERGRWGIEWSRRSRRSGNVVCMGEPVAWCPSSIGARNYIFLRRLAMLFVFLLSCYCCLVLLPSCECQRLVVPVLDWSGGRGAVIPTSFGNLADWLAAYLISVYVKKASSSAPPFLCLSSAETSTVPLLHYAALCVLRPASSFVRVHS